MSRATALCVVVFFATSLTLAYLASHKSTSGSVMKSSVVNVEKTAPAAKPVDTTPAAPVADDVPQ